MITLKIPYKTSSENQSMLSQIRKQFSSVVRYAYNRALEGIKEKEIRIKVKELNNVSGLGSWLTQCAILEGISIKTKNKTKKVIFGGNKKFIQRIQNKLTKEQFQQKRMLPLFIQGEKIQKGNRSFNFYNLDQNKLTLKINKTKHLELELQPMNKNYRNKLKFIQEFSQTKELTVSVRLNENYVYFIYEEPKVLVSNPISSRYMGIDLNPNYIGISIKDNETVLHTQCFNFKVLTDNILNEYNSSNSVRFKYLNNKLKHETIEVSKLISELALKFQCRFVFIEDLKNISQANLDKGHRLNRLTKNLWKRDYFFQNLEKRVKLFGIKLFKVNPMYSSIIGNVQYDYIDPINASLEIARRGYNIIILKNKQFYPIYSIKSSLKDQWKKHLSELEKDWKKLFITIKNSKLRYRVSLEDCQRSYEVLQMKSIKSKVSSYNFI